MISTVTSTVITVITSVTSTSTSTSTSTTSTVAALSFAASLALVSILTLFALLLQKELATASNAPRLKVLGHTIDVALVPLFMTFVMVAVARVVEVLR